MKTITVTSEKRTDMVDITSRVETIISEEKIENGIMTVFVPHTTCGITINEHCDPDVVRDILFQLEKVVPYEDGYHHYEKNADSHIKTSLIGSSETVIVNNGRLVLGTWQGIFLCDFDGPRTRKVHINCSKDVT